MLGLCLFCAGLASAESGVLLQATDPSQVIRAVTFDEEGQPVGESSFELEERADGSKRMRVHMDVEGGGQNVSEAIFAPATSGVAGTRGPGPTMRLLEERSQATSADGKTFPLLVIDHEAKRVSCYPADQGGAQETPGAAKHVEIPQDDRVVNVPMQLLFLPLVRGEIDSLRFQIATCKDGPVLYSMIAVRGNTLERDGRRIIEIEYGPDLGATVAWFASRLLPSFSFWFDEKNGTYLGHRMPLHREGPEITLVRQGLTPNEIGIDD